MAVILTVERRSLKARLFLALIYAILTLGGITMVWPFLVMLAASLTGPYDYYRFSPMVRAVWDRNDRYMRYVASCFPRFPETVFPDAPSAWVSWTVVSRDEARSRAFAADQLRNLSDPAVARSWQRMAADYADFNLDYDISNSVCAFDARDVATFVREQFEARVAAAEPATFAAMSRTQRRDAALALLNREWLIRYASFFGIRMVAQQRAPLHHAGWDYPLDDPKMEMFQAFKRAYRELAFTPGTSIAPLTAAERSNPERWHAFKKAASEASPMTRTLPYESRPLWLAYLKRPDVQERLGFAKSNVLTPAQYAQVAGHACDCFENLPFPLPQRASPVLQAVWASFIHDAYPRRLLRIEPTPELQIAFRNYVRTTCKTPAAYQTLMGKTIRSFDDIVLHPYENSTLWRNFIPHVPVNRLRVMSAEQAWQRYLLDKYQTREGLNRAYGWSLRAIEEVRFPLREALAVTFEKRGWKDFRAGIVANYAMVGEYLFLRGEAFGNTVLLVVLSILATLTVNPLAAYALSRLGLRQAEKILLFMLATMAFPAAVTAIPGFLLIRDLGLLNTFAALVLPTVASGMSIFVLKGFFDGLPRELYEAAMIDGAKEWQVFLKITLPMTTPILAVNALNAFVMAYNSWEWALLVCQKQSNWTLAVWMYQMSQQLADQPWAVMAGFVMVSIPTAVVFIACQKIILRGIVLPSMK